jgi:cortactin
VLPADDAKCSKESDITKPKPLPKTADKRVDEPKTKEKAEETAAETMSSAAPAAAVDFASASSSSSPTSEEDLKVQEVQVGVRNLKSLFENMAKLNSDRDRQVQNEMKAKRYESVVSALQNGTETKATNDGSVAGTKDSTEGSAHLEMHVKEHTFHDEVKKEDPVKAVDVEGERTPKDHPDPAMSTTAVAVQDYDAQADDEISFQAGELIVDIHFEFINDVWWKGVCRGQRGMFPASHVQQQSS